MPDTFVKRGARGVGFFEVEAAGLRWLAAAGPDAARVVEVYEVSADRIVLERLRPARPDRGSAEQFGAALAATHASGAAAFGQPPDGWSAGGYIGTQPMRLDPQPTWGAFYADQRVLPFAEKARAIGNLSPSGMRLVQAVAERLRDGEFDDGRPPARIHGDLWSGNVVFTDAGVTVIDPAAHGGHGLTDLAMLHLFGAPHLETITSAYVRAAGTDDTWPDLLGLHQLHPLLVHAVSHGPSYGAAAERAAARYR